MARAAIVKEISGVFRVYNIEVDIRHLELIADYMVGVEVINLTAAPNIEHHGVRRSRVATSRSTARELTCTRLLY
jgi:hypothetical protein